VYGDTDATSWFQTAWKASGKKLDMGAACVRFKKLEDVPLDVVAKVIARTPVKKYISVMEALVAKRKK
ncbi:MAG TPA: DUF1801 domain-containing protein, partial [Verrucomicrobiae bacterium]|nr:DUF1801 domain-containing protein [Verrucomicrobiae bacterium]